MRVSRLSDVDAGLLADYARHVGVLISSQQARLNEARWRQREAIPPDRYASRGLPVVEAASCQ
jgi:hypothetical protein